MTTLLPKSYSVEVEEIVVISQGVLRVYLCILLLYHRNIQNGSIRMQLNISHSVSDELARLADKEPNETPDLRSKGVVNIYSLI